MLVDLLSDPLRYRIVNLNVEAHDVANTSHLVECHTLAYVRVILEQLLSGRGLARDGHVNSIHSLRVLQFSVWGGLMTESLILHARWQITSG